MRRAAKVDANQGAIVEALRAIGAYVWPIGLPLDLLCGFRGRTVLLEVKTLTGKRAPKPKKHTDLQRDFLAAWNGGPAITVSSTEEAIAAIQ